MDEAGIPYGGLESYRHMCRFYSGFFFKHPMMLKYDFYWRIEPDVDFTCDLDYDPFLFMKQTGKKYGYNIVAGETMETMNGFWDSVMEYLEKTGKSFPKTLTPFGDKKAYNGVHFWSNFEIGDLNWFRSKEYTDFFNHLDRAGGFFYERWGDAPVHSVAAGLLLKTSEMHYFGDIGYRHLFYLTCPVRGDSKYGLKCRCDLTTHWASSRWAYRDSWKDMVSTYFSFLMNENKE